MVAIGLGVVGGIVAMRDDDAPEPVVMEGAVGLVLDLLLGCWQRRPAA